MYWANPHDIVETGDNVVVKTWQDETLQEIEVSVGYPEEDREVKRIVSLINSVQKQVRCNSDTKEKMVNASDIYYIESVDKKTFVYLKEEVFRTEKRLFQLKDELESAGFVQISKSCLLNIHIMESIRPLINSRMEAVLSNGERVFVTRKFLKEIRQALQEDYT